MPLTQREAIQLGLLLLCVPLQYILSTNLSTTVTERSRLGSQLVKEAKYFRDWFSQNFNFKARWMQFFNWFVYEFLELPDDGRPTPQEGDAANLIKRDPGKPEQSPAIEVLQYRERQGIFGTSTSVRGERPPILRFRIGQVVKHKTTGYRAVIIGWDLKPKMPEGWLDKVYGENKMLSNWPHYALLVDERDHKSDIPVNGYVVQTRLELVKNTEVQHSNLQEYFKYFDGAQYIPKDKLRKLYPKD